MPSGVDLRHPPERVCCNLEILAHWLSAGIQRGEPSAPREASLIKVPQSSSGSLRCPLLWGLPLRDAVGFDRWLRQTTTHSTTCGVRFRLALQQ